MLSMLRARRQEGVHPDRTDDRRRDHWHPGRHRHPELPAVPGEVEAVRGEDEPGGIFTAQTSWFASVTSLESWSDQLGPGRTSVRYRYTLGVDAEDLGNLAVVKVAGDWGTAVPLVTNTPASNTYQFTAGATGSIDTDTQNDAWTMNDVRTLVTKLTTWSSNPTPLPKEKGGLRAAFFFPSVCARRARLWRSVPVSPRGPPDSGFSPPWLFGCGTIGTPLPMSTYVMAVLAFVVLSIGHAFSSVYVWVSLQHALNIGMAGIFLSWAAMRFRAPPNVP